MKKLLSLFMLLAAGLPAQNTPTPVTGSVSGRVLDADTNSPLKAVEVHLPEGRTFGKSVKTDSQGRFVFENLPAGKREVRVYDGNLGPSNTAPQFVTVIGGRDTQVDFHTRMFAQVSGRVLDEDGNPIAGLQVNANWKQYDETGFDRHRWHTGELKMRSIRARALTDDMGRYVISTIPAGREYRIAASTLRRNALPISDAPVDPISRRRTLATTYYPNANSIETATSIRLHSQEERVGVDIRMRKSDSYCLEATLTERGAPSQLHFLLIDSGVSSTELPSVNLPGSAASGGDGRIRLCDLYPGHFRLIAARLSTFAQESIGSVDFTISDKDIHDLVVAAIPLSKVSGEIVWDKRPNDISNLSIRVQTYPRGPGLLDPAMQPPPSESFSLSVAVGTSYIPEITGLDSNSYIREITYDGTSILNRPFVPVGGEAKLRITIGTDAGSVTATVLAANNQPCASCAVLVVPVAAQTESEVASTFFAGVTDENGMYREGPLPPGKYEVFATSNPPPNWIDRDQVMLIDRTPESVGKIMRARARGKIVDVGPNAAVSVSLAPIRMD